MFLSVMRSQSGCSPAGAGSHADAELLSLGVAGRIRRPAAVELVQPDASLFQFTKGGHAEYLLFCRIII